MTDNENIYKEIDSLIKKVELNKVEPIFSIEKSRRQNRNVSDLKDDNEILRIFSHLIAYSQNANSEIVERILASGKFDRAFENFDIEIVSKLNPCDIADNHWTSIKGIRQQTKLFHIVTLARRMKEIGSFAKMINEINIPKPIRNERDVESFWTGFDSLLANLEKHKIPFFQSTTSLLHFLLDIGYDCVKPDLVVMKVVKKLGIVDSEMGNKNFRKAVKFIQLYSLDRQIRPSVVDFYFLIDEGQMGAKKFVTTDFYKKRIDDN